LAISAMLRGSGSEESIGSKHARSALPLSFPEFCGRPGKIEAWEDASYDRPVSGFSDLAPKVIPMGLLDGLQEFFHGLTESFQQGEIDHTFSRFFLHSVLLFSPPAMLVELCVMPGRETPDEVIPIRSRLSPHAIKFNASCKPW